MVLLPQAPPQIRPIPSGPAWDHGGVSGNRLRWGALGWGLTVQFFVVEAIAASQWPGYSRVHNVISDLGSALSPARRVMNASFVVQAALILAGAVLLLPALRGLAARVAQVFLVLAAVGVLMLGVFPEDGHAAPHTVGAILYLGGSAVGLLGLAYAVRPRSELLGTTLAVLGLAGASATIFFVAGITQYLGRGGTERLAAYVLPVGLTVAAIALVRMARGAAVLPAAPAAGPSRRELRDRTREERAERGRQRDEALEAAAERRAATPRPPVAEFPDDNPTGASTGEQQDDDLDPDDPWATPTRRRER
jgi:hypothetical membrane protein